jgi:hypothetical protein
VPTPGICKIVLPSNQPVAGGSGNAPATVPSNLTLPFDTVTLQQGPVFLDLSTPGQVKVTEAGVYSFHFETVFTMASPTTDTADAVLIITLSNTGTASDSFQLARDAIRMPAPGGGTVGSVARYLTIEYCGYLPANAIITPQILNYNAAVATVLASDSFMSMTKII